MKNIVVFLLIAVMVFALCGCKADTGKETANETTAGAAETTASTDGTDTTAEGGKLNIVFVCINMQGSFWVQMMEGGEQAGTDYGVNLSFKSAEGALENQISIIENLVTQDVDAIIVDPIDKEGIIPAIEVAGQAGIPVVTAGNQIETDYNWCTIYNDAYDIANITRVVCEKIGGTGKVACVVGMQGSAVSDARQSGFEAAVAEYPNIQSWVLPGNWDASVAQQLVTNLLTTEPDLNAVICGDAVAYEVVQAAEAAKRTDLIVTSLAGMDDNIPYVESGDFYLDLAMGAQRIGYWNVATAVVLAQGQQLEHKLYLPTYIFMNDTNAAEAKKLGLDITVLSIDEAKVILHDYIKEFGPGNYDPSTMIPRN